MRCQSFLLNGELAVIDPNKQHLSAAEYVRAFTHCKSVKVGCNEGGCGACAVELVQHDAATGAESVLAVNSCLLPVGSLAGAAIITAEGLGNSRQGLHQVQARLAGFHGTQCGFCSPGMAISCHAALTAAAAKQQAALQSTGTSTQQHQQQKVSHSSGVCDEQPNSSESASGAVAHDSSTSSSAIVVAAADLLSALDGNLCRCTGWRPIADVAKSFACDVDIEDLGLNTLDPQQLGPISQQQLLPACRKQPQQHQQLQGQHPQQQQQHFQSALHSLQPGSFLVPRTLQQLLAAMQAATAAEVPVHLVAGNTGAGIYKQQWQQLATSVCVVIKHVPELQKLSVIGYTANTSKSNTSNSCNNSSNRPGSTVCTRQMPKVTGHTLHIENGAAAAAAAAVDGTPCHAPYIVAGAGVTITQLIGVLTDLAAAESAVGRQQHSHNLSFLVQHLLRAAGTLVRNAATLGGHLMLIKSKHLESDLLPMMIAAGAELEVVDVHGNAMWLSVESFLNNDSSRSSNGVATANIAKQLGSSALITAVKLPLPLAAAASSSSNHGTASYPRLWSYKLTTHRHANEHAAVNLCCWLDECQRPASHLMNGHAGSNCFKLRIAVGTYQQGSSSSSNPDGVWVCSRAAHVEAAVLEVLQSHHHGQPDADPAAAASLCAALQQLPGLLMEDVHPAGRIADYIRSVAPALCLKGMATVLPPHQQDKQDTSYCPEPAASVAAGTEGLSSFNCLVTPALLAELRSSAVSALSSRCAPPAGHQDLPVDLTAAPPLYWPTQKDGSGLQVSGEAEYADDTHLAAGALYAAYVTSAQPHAQLLGVDWRPALDIEGVVGHVCADDIPAGPSIDVSGRSAWSVGPCEPLFAHNTVEHVGQPLGLVLANTLTAARAGAARVVVEYGPVLKGNSGSSNSSTTKRDNHSLADEGMDSLKIADVDSNSGDPTSSTSAAGGVNNCQMIKPIITLSDAIAADSWYDLSSLPNTEASKGDVSAALSSSSHVVQGQLQIGSQRHFYMEPQTAIATPEEAGRMTVISSCQGTDPVLHTVARLLQLKHNQVHVKCSRVGGGFGGKADRAVFPAAAAAVAARKFRRQVRLVADGASDASMTAGRCPMEVEWSAGLDEQGQLQALKIDVTLVAGAYFAVTAVEACSIAAYLDSTYDIPAFQTAVRAVRCNLPPRSTVRGPGKVSTTLILEQVLQQVAAAAGQHPERFREGLFIKIPHEALAAAAAAQQDEGVEIGSITADDADKADLLMHHQQKQKHHAQRQEPQDSSSLPDIPHPKHYPRCSESGDQQDITVHTTFGKPILLHTYTLPYMWQYLQQASDYAARKAAVIKLNQQHKLKKRGLALVPVRFSTFQGKKLATVTLYSDGSILLIHAGTEMGQGIGTKVKQAAAASLGQLLPAGEAAVLLDYIRIGTASTELMPHAGIAAASTTSEGAAASVAAACDILVERLRPAAEKVAAAAADSGNNLEGVVLWERIVSEVAEPVPAACSKEVMTATALAGFANDGGGWFSYHAFGVGAAEVEVDCCTGERRLLRADLMFDAGRTVNPAIDLGQVEGAFMMGVGHVLHEEVIEDDVSGRTVSNSTWEYKPPGIHELPQELNVHMLKESPVHVPRRKQLSAKAIGEPPMLMSAAVACALQDAIAAAWDDYNRRQHQQFCAHKQPLTSTSVVQACSSGAVGVQGIVHVGMEERCEELQQPVLQLPATTANIKRALPPLL